MGVCKSTITNNKILEKKQKYDSVMIDIVTWNREHQGLYDYDSKNNQTSCIYNITTSGKLVVNNENYSFMEEKDDSVDKFKIVPSKNLRKNVLYIKEEKNEYFLKMEDVINFDEKKIEEYSYNENSLWNVIRYTSNKMGYKLHLNDIVKMGRVRLKLIEMNFSPFPKVDGMSELKCEKSLDQSFRTENSENKIICRICLNGQDSCINPMLSPCNCSGSVKYIHLKCLHTWIKCKVDESQNENCITLLWKNFKCEICKGVIPHKLSYEDQIFDLYELSKPLNNFIIFEICGKKEPKSKGVYIIDFKEKKSFILGRGNESDIKLTDISVSRSHLTLKLMGDSDIFISDNQSKFGTLVLLKKHFKLSEEKLFLQNNRTLLQIYCKRYLSRYMCCSDLECCMKRKKIHEKRISALTELNMEEEIHSIDEIVFSNGNYQLEAP